MTNKSEIKSFHIDSKGKYFWHGSCSFLLRIYPPNNYQLEGHPIMTSANTVQAERKTQKDTPIWDHTLKIDPLISRPSISIFGLGYVGAVSAACFADCRHKIIGVDPDTAKVNLINQGRSPIVEPGLGELLKSGVVQKRIQATTDADNATLNSDISFICVGTPSAEDGSCDLKYLEMVSRDIGRVLQSKSDYHLVVFRSTVPPGTTRKIMLPILEEQSGKKCGADFGLCFHPEFLRESTAIEDFHTPPKTVIGCFDKASGEYLAGLYHGIDETPILTTIEAAEMVKYVDNTWHAVKVSFANEIGKICHANDVDSHEVMDIFVQDTKLNISSYYMKPGFAFGGSCLPKDVRGINHLAEKSGVDTPLLKNILASNQSQIEHALSLVEKCGEGPIGFLGVTFKADTDDLRESPVLPLIAGLLEKGREVSIYDPNLNLEASVRHHLQHSKHADDSVGRLMQHLPDLVRENIADVFSESSIIVVSHKSMLFREAIIARRDDQHVVDLIRLFDGNSIIDQIFEAGMNDYLQKPAGKQQLLKKISYWTGDLECAHTLVVDDDPSIRMVTKARLEKAGHQVSEAENGEEAIHRMKEDDFDIVFMDVSMPVMDGFDATKEARRIPGHKRGTPIVALSAHAVPEESTTYDGICW